MRNWSQILRRLFYEAGRMPRRQSARLAVEPLESRWLLAAGFLQTNLVSNMPGLANQTDPNLINPFGLTASPTTPTKAGSPFWVADNNAGVSTLYNGQGVPQALVVNIPPNPNDNPAQTKGTPTGTVFNTAGAGFDVVAGNDKTSALFLFDTVDGTISAWNPGVNLHNAVIKVNEAGAVFTGLAIDAGAPPAQAQLYAADWGKGTVDVFDPKFNQIDQGAFKDATIPAGFRPFNVQDIGGNIWVTYAQFDPMTGADTGTGGFVDEFSRDGKLLMQLDGDGHFSSPWGVALAPAGFGPFGGDVLVGNFGDGHINAFEPAKGHFRGELMTAGGKPFQEDNLWALEFGNGGNAGSPNTLFFTAGLVDAPATLFGASAGLLGSLQAAPSIEERAAIVPKLGGAATQIFSTVPTTGPTAGDQNPYGIAFVPSGIKPGGVLQAGDLLVSNFNNSANVQGTGSTIMRITPQGGTSVFFQGPPGLGLTTALGVLKSGFVIVGSVPTTAGTAATIQPGSLLILDSNGHMVDKLTDSTLLDSPWDLTINQDGNEAHVFVSNVVSGTVSRIDLNIPAQGKPVVESITRIGSGFMSQPNTTALILGPTGLAFDAKTDTLYVASTADNAIFAIHDAAQTHHDHGTGKLIFKDPHLRGPLGLVLAPNGDLIAANGDAMNPDPNGKETSELVEFTPHGKFVGEFSIDPNPGGAFGVAVTVENGQLRIAAVNDNTNSVDLFTFFDT
jgi:uncharacterized protein (TIGR03118 family)